MSFWVWVRVFRSWQPRPRPPEKERKKERKKGKKKHKTHPASLKAADRIRKLVPVHEMNPKAS